jgi:DNA repair exonuclease SbcCD ATPase subunit
LLYFKSIRWANFLSTGNQFTEISFDTHKTNLIVGENGAGKSSMLDALSYVLFNKPFRKINKPQLINSITRKGLLVECEFTSNGQEYKIIRGMKPNIFEVWKNGTMLNQSAASGDYQDIVEKQILKVNHRSFCQVVILGSASFVPFMQLPGGQRREIIEDLLDLRIFTVMNTLLKTKISNNNAAISDAETKKHVASEKVKLMRSHVQEIKAQNIETMEIKKNHIVNTREQIRDTRHDAEMLMAENFELEQHIADEQSVRVKMREMDKIRIQLTDRVTTLAKEIKFFHEYDNCPTCRQTIDAVFKEETIESRSSKVDDTKNAMEKLQAQYNETSIQLDKISKIQAKIQTNNIEISKLNTRISSWLEVIDGLNKELNNIKEKHAQLDTSAIEAQELELVRLEKLHEQLVNEKEIIAAAALLLKDGGIKAKIIKQYIPIINKLINKYLSAMDFFVNFELDENFDETIGSRFREDFSYASFSEGERMRVNLAVLFTWRAIAKLRNSINTNLLIMDEIMDSSLDTNGTDEFLKILEHVIGDSNVFIISHKTEAMLDKFDNVLRFEKTKNFSRMVQAA